MTVTYDSTTASGSPAIVGFLNIEWCTVGREERKQAVLQDLSRFLGKEALKCVDYVDKSWSEEPFSGGCPVACVPPGNMEYFAKIREPTGRYLVVLGQLQN